MEAYQVLLLILVLVSFLYITLIVYVLGMMREFKNRLKRRLKGLVLLLYERTDAILSIVDLFKKEGVIFSEEETECFNALRALNFDNVSDTQFRELADKVKDATSRMKYLSQANMWATKDETYLNYIRLIDDLERNHRTLVGQYNSDVVAYNYWIKIPTVSWIGWIFGYRSKSNLS